MWRIIKTSLALGLVGACAGFAYAAWHTAPLAQCLEAALITGTVAALLPILLLGLLFYAIFHLCWLFYEWLSLMTALTTQLYELSSSLLLQLIQL